MNLIILFIRGLEMLVDSDLNEDAQNQHRPLILITCLANLFLGNIPLIALSNTRSGYVASNSQVV